MNHDCHRLVFCAAHGTMVAVAETARGRGKGRRASVLAGSVLATALAGPGAALAELPVPSAGGSLPAFVTSGQAAYQVQGNQAQINQVGNTAVLNWQSFNVSPGASVQFRQVDSLSSSQAVQGASFTTLNRIWDSQPSVIAGALGQAAGQKANVILVNGNGIAFMGGAQVDLNSFTASSLDIKDSYILSTLFPGDGIAQFQGDTGFIKVFEGARISAGNFGRVMLLAPTVVNQGKVAAPDGQVIAAAATKVYLRASGGEDANVRGLLVEIDSSAALNDRNTAHTGVANGSLDGQTVALTDASLDKLGHVTNLGELTAARGNVSMVGYAVNQMGIASATTSVVSNGSVYLQAKDRAFGSGGALNPGGAQRGGQVVLGAGSVTSVLPEVGDATATVDGIAGAGLELRSQVQVLGQDIRMEGGARIVAPSGEVAMTAVDIPGSLNSSASLFDGHTPAFTAARIHLAAGALIDVAGLDQVEVSAARNSMAVELRGDELKDSPINQIGPLRGETVYVDVNRALAQSDAGQSTLIARDSLQAYQARTERTVAERSTSGGSVRLYSQGNLLLESGMGIDLSGGSLAYTPAVVNTTLLMSGGRLTDIAEADATVRYDGIATRYVIDYGRWNKTETVDLGQSVRYDPGYLEGKDAGSLQAFGLSATFLQADVLGRTTQGSLQQASGIRPAGASLTIGYDDPSGRNAVSDLALATRDFKINQDVELTRNQLALPQGFGFGDNLSGALAETLTLNADLLAKDRVASLTVLSNQAVTVRDALQAPSGGSFSVIARAVQIDADITSAGGTIDLVARNTVATVPASLSGQLPDPAVRIGDGVQLSVRGDWVNERAGVAQTALPQAAIHGGTISLSAQSQADGTAWVAKGLVSLGLGSVLDADGGARVAADGSVSAGSAGAIRISAYDITGLAANLSAYGMEQGGSLALGSHDIRIASDTLAPMQGLLQLDPAFFSQGGFASYQLTAMDTLRIADGTQLAPRVANRVLDDGYQAAVSGSRLEDFSQQVVREDRLRQAVDLSLIAQQAEVGTGTIVLGHGAHIDADAGATVALQARERIELQGRISAHGGEISATLDRSSGQVSGAADVNPIWLGTDAVLDVSGKARTYVDAQGLTQGEVLAGGSVTLQARTGFVVTQQGSRIDVSGAAPVWLGQRNASGGVGLMVGSDAGSVDIYADQGALLDGQMQALGGSTGQRGGNLALTLGQYVEPILGSAPQADITMSLAAVVAPQAGGLTPTSAIPTSDVVRMRVGTDALERAGFDTLRFSSRDAILLEDGLQLGAGRTLALRDVQLDAARLQTQGGNSAITAETLRVGNQVAGRVPGQATGVPVPGSGTLTLQGRQLELSGALQLDGMAQAELIGLASISLTGVSDGITRPSGSLLSSADLLLQAPVIAPSTYSDYQIRADGHVVQFALAGEMPQQPMSALGSLSVFARDIVQAGRLWAPFGQIDLQASEQLVLADGSLTSVAATADTVLPFGKILNGRSWVYDLDSANVPDWQKLLAELPVKSIRTSGASVTMAAGARVDVAGGGDLQAYEFTVGPGGSRDILSDEGMYAVLPGYQGGVAPSDAQEAAGFKAAVGSAVYLSGVGRIDGGAGLADGVYTLLPAHYALLPGAFAVRIDTGVLNVTPGASVVRQDGVTIAAGYLTDTRVQAPVDALWRGIEVMSQAQVRARSEFTLSQAATFYADGVNRPQDAGQLSIMAHGVGSQALVLDAQFGLAAGTGGLGAAVDISATDLAIASGPVAGLGADLTVLDPDKLSSLGARSLLLGGSRSQQAGVTVLDVSTHTLTLANDAQHGLLAGEVLLAATDTLSLRAGSLIDAQGAAGDAGLYTTEGNGAFLRAASTTAGFERTGSPDRSAGSLVAEAGSMVRAASSITMDATRDNSFAGGTDFRRNGVAVSGNLAVGATRIHLGAAGPVAEGITYDQAALDAMDSLASLSLTSYSSFDLYGAVTLGGVDAVTAKPLLQELNLRGAGLAGFDNAGQVARLRAQTISLSNPSGAAFATGAATGSGSLELQTEHLSLGSGSKAVLGFDHTVITAAEMVGQGTGRTDVAGTVDLALGRMRGDSGSDQTLSSTGAMSVTALQSATAALAPVTALGARWQLDAAQLAFDSTATLPSGALQLMARQGDLQLGAHAQVDVAGRLVSFFDVAQASWGGDVTLSSVGGNIALMAGALVDVSAAAGGDAGTLRLLAADGNVALAPGSVLGHRTADASGGTGAGAAVEIDSRRLDDFSQLNAVFEGGGFDGERRWRARSGDVIVAQGDHVQADTLRISADAGAIVVAGTLDASGAQGGAVDLYARDDVRLLSGARIDAHGDAAAQDGGAVMLASRDGRLVLESGSAIAVQAGMGGNGGTVALRASRTGAGAGTDVAVASLDSEITGARSIAIEAVKAYDGKTTLTATGSSTGATLSLATVNSDNTAFALNRAGITSRLGQSANAAFHILSGVEVRSSGNLTLGADWNLINSRAGAEPGVLTLRAAGSLLLNSNLSDGFSVATACTTATCAASNPSPAALRADNSWSYRLVAGADSTAADPLAVKAGANHVTLAAGKLVRTGTGNIDIAAGGNIVLADNKSAIYTAGRLADSVAGFTNPASILRPAFAQDGGDLSLLALGDIVGKPSTQLYSEWLYRQGAINPATDTYASGQQTAWWVRFDQFAQGVGALGGGDVTIEAGGKIADLSASIPSQGRMASTAPDADKLVRTGGGALSVSAGGNLLGGSYYVDGGRMELHAGGQLMAGSNQLAPILALGDAQAVVQADGDLTIAHVLNPQLLVQSAGNLVVGIGVSTPRRSLFSAYTADTAVDLQSLTGSVTLEQGFGIASSFAGLLNSTEGKRDGQLDLAYWLPGSLLATAWHGDITVGTSTRNLTMSPAAFGQLRLLAADNVTINSVLSMSDRDPTLIPDAVRPVAIDTGSIQGLLLIPSLLVNPERPSLADHAAVPIHATDPEPARVYAVAGDVSGFYDSQAENLLGALNLSKAVRVHAGGDVRDLGVTVQHAHASDRSQIDAGRDVVFSGTARRDNARLWVSGPGSLQVSAGRSIDLGTSAGIVSRGDLDNAALGSQGASLELVAGTGTAGVDDAGAVARLAERLAAGSPAIDDLWLARWLTGNDELTEAQALAAVQAVAALPQDALRVQVRNMVFTALRTTGRDANAADSGFASDFARGYAALELLFPGIGEKDGNGRFLNYAGSIDLFASRVKTERGGDISFLLPGGSLTVGLSNTPASLVDVGSNVLGMVVAGAGTIRGFARDDMLVNQSRVLTVGGGDVLLWSSEGDIDAGKGKKTASAVPPPLNVVDAKGNVTQVLQGAVAGSGIGALSTGSGAAGDVDLIAPRGAVNAGDAGIRAGNLNIAALVVIGSDNIAVSGSSTGTPVADTSAITAAASGATTGGDEVSKTTAALTQSLADSAQAAQTLAQAVRPSIVRVEVLGFGDR